MSVVVPPARVLAVTFPLVLVFLQLLVRALLATSGYRKITATSWWRSIETNLRVRGDVDSQHLLGLAVDVVGPYEELQLFLVEARGVGLVAIEERTHVHVQLLPAGQAAVLGLFGDRGVFV